MTSFSCSPKSTSCKPTGKSIGAYVLAGLPALSSAGVRSESTLSWEMLVISITNLQGLGSLVLKSCCCSQGCSSSALSEWCNSSFAVNCGVHWCFHLEGVRNATSLIEVLIQFSGMISRKYSCQLLFGVDGLQVLAWICGCRWLQVKDLVQWCSSPVLRNRRPLASSIF